MLPTVVARSSDRSVDRPCHLQSLPRRALAIAPLRLVLAVAGLVAAVVAGSARASALLAFGATTLGTVFFVIADPRARFSSVPGHPPQAPPGASEDGVGRLVLSAAFPSTIGVTLLLAIALVTEPTLAAVMAGILAGLGLAALAASFELRALERRHGLRLFVERGTSQVLCRPQDHGQAHGGDA